METLDYLIEELKDGNNAKFVQAPLGSLSFSDDGSMIYDDIVGELSGNAIKQLEEILGIPGSNFLAGAPVEVRTPVIQYYHDKKFRSGIKIKIKGQGASFKPENLGFWVFNTGFVPSFGRADIVHVTISEMLSNLLGIVPEVITYEDTDDYYAVQLCSIVDKVDVGSEDDRVCPGLSIIISKEDFSAEIKSLIHKVGDEASLILGDVRKVSAIKSDKFSEADYIASFVSECESMLANCTEYMTKYITAYDIKSSDAYSILERVIKEFKLKDNDVADIQDYLEGGDDNKLAVPIAIAHFASDVMRYGFKDGEKFQAIAGEVLLDNADRCPTCDTKICKSLD